MNYLYLILGFALGIVYLGREKNARKQKFVPYEAQMKLKNKKTIVLGSGGARKIEDGENAADCQKQLDEVFYAVGDIAKEYETTVVIEPLNKGETNVINTVTEGAAMARRVSHPNILLLADIENTHHYQKLRN